MLSYALAIAIAFSSLVLFSTAFLMSDIHRQDDFLWSGVGLFYALVLWFCARNITGAVLLGQAAVTTLVVSYSWQTLKLRKAVANPEQAAEINNFSLLKAANGLLNWQKVKSQPEIVSSQIESPEKVTDKAIAIPKAVAPTSSAKNPDKTKSGRFGRFFGKQKKSNITNTKLNEILEEEETSATSKNNDNDAVKSSVEKTSKAAKSPIPEKVEPTQTAAANKSAAKSSIASETSTQPVSEPIKTSQPAKDSNTTIPEVPKAKPVVDSVDSASKPPTKQNKQSITVAPVTAINAPKSSVSQENKPQTISQEVSDVEDSQIENKNPAKSTNKPQTEDIFDSSTDTANTSPSDTKVVKPSVLDSLETVEVAEVLEALPEDTGNSRGQGEENIIEVTTTEINEINIATEVTKMVQDNESASEEKQT